MNLPKDGGSALAEVPQARKRRSGAIIAGFATVDLCGVFCALAPWDVDGLRMRRGAG